MEWITQTLNGIVEWIMTTVGNLLYFVAKWMLFIVDVLFSYVQELCGLNMDLSSLETAVSADSDIIFNLLLSSQETTIQILRSLIGLAIVLIIIFSIGAVIRTQYKAAKENSSPNVWGVLKTSFKSIILLLITPLISLLGIIASDVVLQSLYNATNVGASTSLSSTIFATSASSANCYRIYAQNGLRIPITCDFTNEEEFIDYYQDLPITDQFTEYMQSYDSAIYTTMIIFNTNDFITYDSINNILYSNNNSVTQAYDNYYTIYDVNTNYYSDEGANQYRKIESYAEEYYVMADVVDYFVQTTTPYYYKTIQDVLDSIYDLPNTVADEYKIRLMNNLIELYHIQFLNWDLEVLDYEYNDILRFYSDIDWQVIRYVSNYYTSTNNSEPSIPMQIQYNHIRGQSDEFYGAKYIIAVEEQFTLDGVNYTYFVPLTNGYSENNISEFRSYHIANGQIISAKGIFNNATYPTAIKKSGDGSEIQFYRDNIETIAVGQASEIFSVNFQQDGNIFSRISFFFSAIFDPESLVPEITFNPDAIQAIGDKETVTVNTVDSGRVRVGYLMDSGGALSSTINQYLTGSVYGLHISNIYKVENLNFLILVVGTIILMKVCFVAIFALISRAYELMLIIIIYPTACATIPISNEGYATWLRTYISRLVSTYGIILGINFVFILFPVIQNIEFFSQEAVGSSTIVRRVASLFFNVFSVSEITRMMNMVVVVLFELVAFTLIQTVPKMVSDMVSSPDETKSDVLGNLGMTLKRMAKTITAPITITRKAFSVGKTAVKAITHPAETAKKAASKIIPGSALIEARKDRKYVNKKKKEQKQASTDLKNSMKRSTTESGSADADAKKKEVMDKLDKFQKAQKSYTDALADPRGSRKAEEAQKKPKSAENAKSDKPSKKSRNDGDEENNDGTNNDNDTNNPQDENDYTDKTGKELRDIEKDSKASYKYLKKKGGRKQKKLTAEEAAEYEKSKSQYESAKAERKSRRRDRFGRQRARKRVENYEARMNAGEELTARQKKTYEKSKAKLDRVQTRKDNIAAAKQNKKQVARERQDREIFRNNSWLGRQRQKGRMEELDQEMANLDSQLQQTGYNGNQLKSMDLNEMNNLINSGELNDEQKEIVQEYAQKQNYKSRMLAETAKEYAGQQMREQKEQEEKDIDLAGGHGLNIVKQVRKGVNNIRYARLGDISSQINDIDAKIKEMQKDVNADNLDEYRKLISEREKLLRLSRSSAQWNRLNTDKSYLKQKKNRVKQAKKADKNAVYAYEVYRRKGAQTNLSLDDYIQGIERTNRNLRRKKDKDKDKDK